MSIVIEFGSATEALLVVAYLCVILFDTKCTNRCILMQYCSKELARKVPLYKPMLFVQLNVIYLLLVYVQKAMKEKNIDIAQVEKDVLGTPSENQPPHNKSTIS